jgi:hypothetical protein
LILLLLALDGLLGAGESGVALRDLFGGFARGVEAVG